MNRINGTSPLGRYLIATGATIAAGNLVTLNGDGNAVPAADASGLTVIGYAKHVADGAVEIADGVIGVANDTTNAVARTARGKVCYVKDANIVDNSGGTNKIVAGLVVDVYDGEVLIDVTPQGLCAARANAMATVVATHAHAITDITGLQTALDAKQDAQA